MISKNRVKVCYAKGCSAEFETPKPARMYCNGEECNLARAEAKRQDRRTQRQRDSEGKFMSSTVVRDGVVG
jgi:hypothetical protein